jgi:hypothetical protein
MSSFEQLLTAPAEELLKTVFKTAASCDRNAPGHRSREIAQRLGLTHGQLICALGFNPHMRDLPDVAMILGFAGYEDLAGLRDQYFTQDVYERIGIRDILAIYAQVAQDRRNLGAIQALLPARLQRIEERIERTVASLVIERYKKEVRSLYADGVAQPAFVEDRLAKTHSGFRALLNEVLLVVQHRVVPVGDIFFRDAVLPEEKRRLIASGLVPRELVVARLGEPGLAAQERAVLEEQLRLM